MVASLQNRYYDLVHEFPLIAIKDSKTYHQALSTMEDLMLKDRLAKPEEQYLEALSVLVSAYEAPKWQAFDESIAPHRLLAGFMKLHEVSAPELYPLVGGQSHLSEILNGKRPISEKAAAKLSKRFNVSPRAFRRLEEE
jgi:HTH-type transcriptional regulator / antitoxin HigA